MPGAAGGLKSCVKSRLVHVAAALAVLLVRAPTPDLYCRVECEAAAARESSAATPVAPSCHESAAAPQTAPSGQASCERHAAACALAATSDGMAASTGASASREVPSVLVSAASAIGARRVAIDSAARPRPFTSPPAGLPSSVRRL